MSRAVTALPLVGLLLLLFAAGADVPADEGPLRLEDGVPRGFRLTSSRSTWHAALEVPKDATRVNVLVSADRDVDLYLRHGEPAQRDFAETADVAAFSPSAHEVLSLEPGKDAGRIRSGTWYVTVANPFPSRGPAGCELIAFVDRPGKAASLVPGTPVAVRMGRGRATRVRTYVPSRAARAVMELVPPPTGGLRFDIDGPQGFSRNGVSRQGRLVIEGGEAPAGVHLLSLAPASSRMQAMRVTARLALTFVGGGALPVPPSPELEAGVPLPFTLGGTEHPDAQRLRLEVPKGMRGFVLEAANAGGHDVDLYVRRGSPPRREDEDAHWLGVSTAPVERVVVAGRDRLPAGTYHVEVVLLDRDSPVEVVVTLRALGADAPERTWGETMPPQLAPDVWTQGKIEASSSAITWHALRLPKGTESLHAQLLDASGPLELVVANTSDGSIRARAFSAMVDEHLGVTFRPALQADRQLLLGVLNRSPWEPTVTYRVAVGVGRRPTLPEDLAWPPVFEGDDLRPAERAAAATVEITIGDCSGGSGVCVSPRGHVISCRHCLQLTDGTGRIQRDRILVAFPRTLDAPPVQVFFARIEAEDRDRDLVLLSPLRDVFGRPIGPDTRFPHLELGESHDLRLGDELFVAGYPQMGSECVRTAIVLSHGIVAGLERQPTGPAWIKTDAWVAPGHSGGAVVDARGRLVGLAAATLGCTESLGLCVPVERLPKRWREIIAPPPKVEEAGTGG